MIALGILILAIIPSLSVAINSSTIPPDLLFEEAVKAIARKEEWAPEIVRVSKFAAGSVRIARSRKLQLQVRTGNSAFLLVTFPEELDGGVWRKPKRRGRERRWRNLDKPLPWPRPKLNPFDIAGPLELKAVGDDRLSILLPGNATHANLKRVVVGRGIRIIVKGAGGISLSSSSASEMKTFWFGDPSICFPMLSISITGPASLSAYKNHDQNSYIETSLQSPESLELLPDKCYHGSLEKDLIYPGIFSVLSQMNMPESLLSIVLGDGGMVSGPVKARLMAYTLVRFKVEVEREIRDDDRVWSEAPKWKSRPGVERYWFEVLSRAGAGTALQPVFHRRLRSPVISDSVLLGSLLPNVSFTRLHYLVRSPEVFTLDVKW